MKMKTMRHWRDISEVKRRAREGRQIWKGGRGTIGEAVYSWARPWLNRRAKKGPDVRSLEALIEDEGSRKSGREGSLKNCGGWG